MLVGNKDLVEAACKADRRQGPTRKIFYEAEWLQGPPGSRWTRTYWQQPTVLIANKHLVGATCKADAGALSKQATNQHTAKQKDKDTQTAKQMDKNTQTSKQMDRNTQTAKQMDKNTLAAVLQY